jgi:hypothetical protein
MNEINLIQVDDNTFEINLITVGKILKLIHNLKPYAQYNKDNQRWQIPANFINKFCKDIEPYALIYTNNLENKDVDHPSPCSYHTAEEYEEETLLKNDDEIKSYPQKKYLKSQNQLISKSITLLNHRDKIGIKISEYNREIFDAIKKITGAYYDKPFLTVALHDYHKLKAILKKFQSDWKIKECLDIVDN